MANKYKLAVIGCGKMGTALIHGWLNADLLNTAEILDPNKLDDSLTSHNDLFHVKLMESLSLDNIDAVILAIKPQIIESVCTDLSKLLPSHTPVVSIAAGTDTKSLQKYFGEQAPVIRCMPNTPAAIGKGASVLFATPTTTEDQKHMASRLFDAVGEASWVEDEALMNAVTALSGSGPAYVFHLIEVMEQAGIKCGLSPALSNKLARQTVIGAAALAEHEQDTPASTLRQNVTSPGGTTEAGLNVLMDGTFQDIINKTLLAAKTRGEELADQ